MAGVTSPRLGGEDSQPFFVWELEGGGSLVLIRKNTHTHMGRSDYGQTEQQKMQIWKLSIGFCLWLERISRRGFLQQHFGHISLKGLGSKKKLDIMIYNSLPLFLEI